MDDEMYSGSKWLYIIELNRKPNFIELISYNLVLKVVA
jgi:hypothetical protein